MWAVVERTGQAIDGQDAWARGRSLCVAVLCLLLAVVPVLLSKSHGPGAYAEAQRAEAAITQHGHAHDWDEHGAGNHNAADHDHGSFVYVVSSENGFLLQSSRMNFRLTGNWLDGPEGGGLHRPPRATVL